MNTNFVLGYIAGEGSFGVRIRLNDEMKAGVQLLPWFAVSAVKEDLPVIEHIQSLFGGSICSVEVDTEYHEQRRLQVGGFKGCREIINLVDSNKGCGFDKIAKGASYGRWKEFIQNYETPRNKDEALSLIESAKQINPYGTGGKSIDEWEQEIVDIST